MNKTRSARQIYHDTLLWGFDDPSIAQEMWEELVPLAHRSKCIRTLARSCRIFPISLLSLLDIHIAMLADEWLYTARASEYCYASAVSGNKAVLPCIVSVGDAPSRRCIGMVLKLEVATVGPSLCGVLPTTLLLQYLDACCTRGELLREAYGVYLEKRLP